MNQTEPHVPTAQNIPTGAVATIVVLCAIWGVQQVAIKVANADISPVLQAGFRSIGAVVLLMAWAAFRGQRLIGPRGDWLAALAIGLLFTLNHVFLFVGLDLTSASRGVVLYYTTPFFVALGAHLAVPGERLSVRGVIGMGMAFAGTALVLTGRPGDTDSGQLLGDLICIGAALTWATTLVFIKSTTLVRAPAASTLFYQLGVSAVLLPVVSWWLGEDGVSSPSALTLGAVAYQIVIVAFLSYLTTFWLLKRYRAANLSAFFFLTPVFGVIAGVTLLGEPLSAGFVAGASLVAAGIYVVNS